MNLGFHFAGIVVDLLLYTDDMVIIAPSWQALQTLLLAVEDDACKINMSFNPQRRAVFVTLTAGGAKVTPPVFPERIGIFRCGFTNR